jgi:hypothetical protein
MRENGYRNGINQCLHYSLFILHFAFCIIHCFSCLSGLKRIKNGEWKIRENGFERALIFHCPFSIFH